MSSIGTLAMSISSLSSSSKLPPDQASSGLNTKYKHYRLNEIDYNSIIAVNT